MTDTLDPRCRELLREAAEWRLLSLLFECPEGAWRAQVEAVATEIEDAELRSCAELALDQADAGLYHSMFGPGGPAAPREVSHHDALEFGRLMSELRTYYDAFGYGPRTPEAPDHVSVETGFVSFLKMKEAFALDCGDSEHVGVTAEAAARFRRDHLSRVSEPLAAQLAGSGLGYLADAGQALVKRTGPGPRRNPGRPGQLPVLNDDGALCCSDFTDGEDNAPSDAAVTFRPVRDSTLGSPSCDAPSPRKGAHQC
jgi:nitrate reductase assembly molybdenum cofactor insertion protein NarJ